jgi:hypothetical protein
VHRLQWHNDTPIDRSSCEQWLTGSRQVFFVASDANRLPPFQGGLIMEQRYDGTPLAAIRLEGRRIIRNDVSNDWGLRLQWEIKRNGQVVATPNARPDMSYELVDTAPGNYEIVLQMWRYVSYAKNPQGEFTASRFIDISNRVTITI